MITTNEYQAALAAVLLVTGPVRVGPLHAVQAATATLIMEQDLATDGWTLRAVPSDPVAVAPADGSVLLHAG
jgi:hypothetical protein